MAKKAVEQFLKNIQTDPNVDGVTIVHRDGIPIKSSLENKVAVEHSSLASHLTRKTEAGLQEIDEADSLVSIWATSVNKEILITKEDNYILVVTKKVMEEKFDHEDCKYCEQFNEEKI